MFSPVVYTSNRRPHVTEVLAKRLLSETLLACAGAQAASEKVEMNLVTGAA